MMVNWDVINILYMFVRYKHYFVDFSQIIQIGEVDSFLISWVWCTKVELMTWYTRPPWRFFRAYDAEDVNCLKMYCRIIVCRKKKQQIVKRKGFARINIFCSSEMKVKTWQRRLNADIVNMILRRLTDNTGKKKRKQESRNMAWSKKNKKNDLVKKKRKKNYGLGEKRRKRTWATGLLASQLSSSRPLLPRQIPWPSFKCPVSQ